MDFIRENVEKIQKMLFMFKYNLNMNKTTKVFF
jgi:hypothetical protein